MAKGDLIYVYRNHEILPLPFKHYGIDCGETVIHYADFGKYHQIVCEPWNIFLKGGNYEYEYNKNYQGICYAPEVIIQRAKSRLGERKYHLLTNNCEHFVRWCKTGESISYQIDVRENFNKEIVNTLGIILGISVAATVKANRKSLPIITGMTGIAIATGTPIPSLVNGAKIGSDTLLKISKIFNGDSYKIF
ncbi:MAG: lecithin retinol acyltransferase family protein [Trichodesmium sp.]